MSIITFDKSRAPARSSDFPARAARIWRQWRQRQAGRRQLRQMTAFELKDIGLTEADRNQEAAKPFWQD